MRYLLYFSCLSIVLIGCGSKRYENIPQDPIHLQAKVDAESDAKHDVNLLAYFGAGMSAPLAAGMCALTTGCIADLHFGPRQPEPSYIIAAVSAATVFSLLTRYYTRLHPPNPPPERLIGKSPEYIKFYADAYRAKMRSYQIKSGAAGSVFGCLTLTGGTIIIYLGAAGMDE